MAEARAISAAAKADQAFAERARRRRSFVVARLVDLFPEAPHPQVVAAVEAADGELGPAYQVRCSLDACAIAMRCRQRTKGRIYNVFVVPWKRSERQRKKSSALTAPPA